MRMIAIGVVVALLAGACGDAGDTEPPAPTEQGRASSTSAAQTSDATTTTQPVTTTTMPPERSLPSTEGLEAFAAEFDGVITATVAADGEHDKELTRQFYTDDVVVIDSSVEDPGATNIDEMLDVYGKVWALAPQEVTEVTDTYIGTADGVAVLLQYNLLGYSEEAPMIEYRLHGIRDGKVAYWTAFYDPTTRPFFTEVSAIEEAAEALRDDYVRAWTSADPAAVAGLFAADATYSDPLAGGLITGSVAIGEHAATLMAHDITWSVVGDIGSRDITIVRSGSVLEMKVTQPDGTACAVEMLVILEGSHEGIVDARVYYDAEALVACGMTA